MEDRVDYTKIPKELRDKMEEWSKNSPANKQLQTLTDLTDIVQELLGVVDEQREEGATALKGLGATLLDIREKLTSLDGKEAPETPDHAKPVVSAISELKKALTASIKAIEVKPEVKVSPPEVKIPQAPKVDLSALEELVKTEMPKAFKEAIKLLPKPKEVKQIDYTERFDEMMEWFESIDRASRMKPQFPVSQLNEIKDSVSATASSTVVFDVKNISPPDDPEIATYKYFGFVQRGSANWRIMRKTLATNVFLYATGASEYSVAWADKDGQSYA